MDALNCTSLGGVLVHGGVGGSRSMWKGKERVDTGGSLGKSDKDGDEEED